MRRFNVGATLVLASATLWVSPVNAATTVTFDGLSDGVSVDNYYNGGTASDGSSGANFGVGFGGFEAAVGYNAAAGPIAYNATAVAFGNVAAGFSSLSYQYYFFLPGTITVFDGINGTGSVLGTANYTASATLPTAPWTAGSVSFSGVARSFSLSGTLGTLGLDNVSFGSTAAVPEPATWATMVLGLGVVGFALRRRRKVFATVRFA